MDSQAAPSKFLRMWVCDSILPTKILQAILATFREDLKTTLHKEKKNEAQYEDQMKTNKVVALEKRQWAKT